MKGRRIIPEGSHAVVAELHRLSYAQYDVAAEGSRTK
jgi:hypothetical protein